MKKILIDSFAEQKRIALIENGELVELIFEKDALKAVANKAIKNGTGARGLRTIMEDVLLNIMYTVPDQVKGKTATLTVTKECIEENKDPILTIHKNKDKGVDELNEAV